MGGLAGGAVLLEMMRDLLELMESTAENRSPVREVVGEDPVEFIETFITSYTDKTWMDKERARLRDAIDRAAAQEGTS